MKVSKLAEVIRKIVRDEVKKEVGNLIAEQKLAKGNSEPGSGTMSLTEALSQTESEAYPTMKTFNAADARAGFAAMQDGQQAPNALQGHNGRVVPTEKIDPSVTKAMTRDYSELVKRFKK